MPKPETAPRDPWLLTAGPLTPRFDFEVFYQALQRRGYVIYPGKLTVAENFRVGCIGSLGEPEMRGALAAMRAALEEMGVEQCAPGPARPAGSAPLVAGSPR